MIDADGIPLIDGAEEVRVDGIEYDSPAVGFNRHGQEHTIDCDFVVGCDGAHGVSREFIPTGARRTYRAAVPVLLGRAPLRDPTGR